VWSDEVRKIDAKFINDTFWLLLPLHLSWSDDVKVRDMGEATTPLGKVKARRIRAAYPPDSGGYTPGDMYHLYVDGDWRIMEWTYHKSGADEATLATRWTQTEQAGPLKLNTEFRNKRTGFHLWFTDISVRVK